MICKKCDVDFIECPTDFFHTIYGSTQFRCVLLFYLFIVHSTSFFMHSAYEEKERKRKKRWRRKNRFRWDLSLTIFQRVEHKPINVLFSIPYVFFCIVCCEREREEEKKATANHPNKRQSSSGSSQNKKKKKTYWMFFGDENLFEKFVWIFFDGHISTNITIITFTFIVVDWIV